MLRPLCRGAGLAEAGEVSPPRGAIACGRGSLLGGVQAHRLGQEQSRPPASCLLKGTEGGKGSQHRSGTKPLSWGVLTAGRGEDWNWGCPCFVQPQHLPVVSWLP